MPESVSFRVFPIFWKSLQFLTSSWRKGMRNCGWAGVFLCAISGYLFKIAGRVVSSASTAPVPSADWPTRSLCRLASFCTASSPASCALCRNRKWRRRQVLCSCDIYGWAAGAPPLALLTVWVLTHAVVAPQGHASRLVLGPLLQVFGLLLWPLTLRLGSLSSCLRPARSCLVLLGPAEPVGTC